MADIPVSVVTPALETSDDPLARELLARLAREAPVRARATRAYDRRAAIGIYQAKAAKGDRAGVRTDGYPALFAGLETATVERVIVHGVTFEDVVYLVFTDADRRECLGMLRKRRTAGGR